MSTRFFLRLSIVSFVAIFALTASPSYAAAAPKLEVSGWIPYWRAATGTADALAHIDRFTEINPFGYTVKKDGTLNDPMGIDEEPWKTLIAEAKKRKIRIVPTVMWSDGATIHAILSNTKSRIALEDEIAALVKAKGFDGIDIDFEGKYAETKPYFSLFLKGLYVRMGNKWVMCTIEARTPISSRYSSTPPKDAGVYANDYNAINKYCDRVRIMAYDQGAIDVTLNKARYAPYIPVADPGWVEKVMELTSKSIPKKKLVIGVATYGYEYKVTPLSEYGFRYDREWSFNPRYALDLAAQLGITPTRNGANEISFIYKNGVTPPPQDPSVNQSTPTTAVAQNAGLQTGTSREPFNIVWWSDAVAIKDKVDIAKAMGLRGIAVFKIDGGEDPKMWDVLPRVR